MKKLNEYLEVELKGEILRRINNMESDSTTWVRFITEIFEHEIQKEHRKVAHSQNHLLQIY